MAMVISTIESTPDVEKFETILNDYQDRVYNQAYRMLGNREDAEEATQDIFLSIHKSLGNFRGDSKLSTWIYRIVSNVCISRLRKKQLEIISLDDPLGDDGATISEIIPDKRQNQQVVMESEETAEMVRANVQKLPPDWAMAVSLCHFDDLSYDEAAEIMGIPKATVATYIFRGRKQLAKQLMNQL
ncbi:RNA polymerase sigma factor [Candidatus Latescibacterota bacterium]